MIAPSRVERAAHYLSAGARRALLRHSRDDGELFEGVLDTDDAEELWFCSMLHLRDWGERIVTRQRDKWGHGLPYSYRPTPLGYAVRDMLRDSGSDAERGDANAAPSEGSQSGPKGIAQPEVQP